VDPGSQHLGQDRSLGLQNQEKLKIKKNGHLSDTTSIQLARRRHWGRRRTQFGLQKLWQGA